MPKRILVDMSATLIHHGHIRLLQKASKLGSVIVALTTDEEVEKKKGYKPELSFAERKEILESIKYVDEVIPSAWLIDLDYLQKHNIDYLVHGDDDSNMIPDAMKIIFPRTAGVSSSELRLRVIDSLIALNINKNRESSTKLAQSLFTVIKQNCQFD